MPKVSVLRKWLKASSDLMTVKLGNPPSPFWEGGWGNGTALRSLDGGGQTPTMLFCFFKSQTISCLRHVASHKEEIL